MNEAEVFAALRDLVERGEYLDEIPGVPGARLSGGGCFRDDRRLYARGCAEYLQARAAGSTERLPPLTTAPVEAVEQVEALIGCALPSLLRRAYLDLGDGGFGPGYGLLSLNDASECFERPAQTPVTPGTEFLRSFVPNHASAVTVCASRSARGRRDESFLR